MVTLAQWVIRSGFRRRFNSPGALADTHVVPVEALRSHASLVSARRFGAALVAARSHEDASLITMSRRSDNWWRPDELAAFEQGSHVLDDPSVLAIARLYRLRGCAVAEHSSLQIVLDRSTANDLNPSQISELDGDLDASAERLAAFGLIVGATVVERDHLEIVSRALDCSSETLSAAIERASGRSSLSLTMSTMAARVVVPLIGVLIAHTPNGSVLATRPAGRRGRPTLDIPGAAPLRSVLVSAGSAPESVDTSSFSAGTGQPT